MGRLFFVLLMVGMLTGIFLLWWRGERDDRRRASLPPSVQRDLQGATRGEIAVAVDQYRLLSQTMGVVERVLNDESIWTYLPSDLTKDLKDIRDKYRNL